MMLRFDLMRSYFDGRMIEIADEYGLPFQWLGVNSSIAPDYTRLIIRSSFLPGRVQSSEVGGKESAAIRDGVYMITLSIPQNVDLSRYWGLASRLEQEFRREDFAVGGSCAWCGEPYTENRGTEPDSGRFVISVTVPWSAVN